MGEEHGTPGLPPREDCERPLSAGRFSQIAAGRRVPSRETPAAPGGLDPRSRWKGPPVDYAPVRRDRRGWAAAALLAAAVVAGCATPARRSGERPLEDEIGQLFVYVSPGPFVNEESTRFRELVRQVTVNRVGGIHWASGSSVFETAFMTSKLQGMTREPLLVSADLEAGVGMRFADATYWPWPMALAATGDPTLAAREGEAIGEEARAIGFNQIYAPVADVNGNPDNPVINTRSYGEDPADVARFVTAFVRGVQKTGVLATVKHFPGHGDTQSDSHRALPVLRVSRDRLFERELVPFRAAIEAGVASVMTAHISVPALDATPIPIRPEGPAENPYTSDLAEVTRNGSLPASLSPAITGGLLRGELGFRGLVVTDAVDMGGIVDHFGVREAAVRAVLAGADEVVKSPDVDGAIEAVRDALRTGRIPRERIDAALRRIREAKAKAGVPKLDVERIFRVVDSPAHRALAQEIVRRSLTLVREEPGALPLARGARVYELTVTENPARLAGMEFWREIRARAGSPIPAPGAFLDVRSTDADVDRAVGESAGCDVVVVALFVHFQTGRGTLAVPPPARAAIERIVAEGKRVVVVAFGSPYSLREIPAVRTYLAAYGSQEDAQVAAAQALYGETEISGRLPVTIPRIAARGSGIRKERAADR
jgi:beta-N-acetylhexosaminidase